MRKILVGFVATATLLLPLSIMSPAEAKPCKIANVLKKTICL